ncbi:MAG TPA: hypothetical protein PKA64_23700 [Myxococcota bacterium]|nr:hypothetical protein [Myxococcota bacterium]
MRFVLLLLAACRIGDRTCADERACDGQCGPPPAAAIAAPDPDDPSKALTLDDHAWDIFKDELGDLRAGVRPVPERGLVWCGGADCDPILPFDVAELPAGRWRLRAELAVPHVPDRTFHGRFEHTCALEGVTADGETRNQDQVERDLEVTWETSRRGVILDPLVQVVSPDPAWKRTCAWELSFENPRGQARWAGRYTVATAPSQAPAEPATP